MNNAISNVHNIELYHKSVIKQARPSLLPGSNEDDFFRRHPVGTIYVKKHARDRNQLIDNKGFRCFFSLVRKLDTGGYLELFLFADVSTNCFIQEMLSATDYINHRDTILINLNKRWLNTIFDHFLSVS